MHKAGGIAVVHQQRNISALLPAAAPICPTAKRSVVPSKNAKFMVRIVSGVFLLINTLRSVKPVVCPPRILVKQVNLGTFPTAHAVHWGLPQ